MNGVRSYLLKLARELVQRHTYARRRAEAQDFIFTRIQVEPHFDGNIAVAADFTYICGKHERLVYMIDELAAEAMSRDAFEDLCDPALQAQRRGSFSIKHLLADGYTPEQVESIIERGYAFDRENGR